MFLGPGCHPGRGCVNVANIPGSAEQFVDLTKTAEDAREEKQEDHWLAVGDLKLTIQDQRDLGSQSHLAK